MILLNKIKKSWESPSNKNLPDQLSTDKRRIVEMDHKSYDTFL